jgi:hypothetical protein
VSPETRVEACDSVKFEPLEWESYEDTGAVRKPRRIVTAPLAGAAYIKARASKRCLTHAVELAADGTPLRVLCGKVKLSSVLDDATQYDVLPLDCDACVNKFGVDS